MAGDGRCRARDAGVWWWEVKEFVSLKEVHLPGVDFKQMQLAIVKRSHIFIRAWLVFGSAGCREWPPITGEVEVSICQILSQLIWQP